MVLVFLEENMHLKSEPKMKDEEAISINSLKSSWIREMNNNNDTKREL